MSQRTERVDELLRQEIGALLAKEIADPRIGFATITDVETSPDLRHAKVWVSVIGGKADRDETLRALQQSMGYVRHELGRRLRIRRIPELHVRLDDSAERGTRLLHLLNELEAGADPQAIEPFTDSLPTPVRRLPHEGDTDDPADGRRVAGRAEAAAAAAWCAVGPRREPAVEGPSDQAGRRRVRLGQVGPRQAQRQARIRQARLSPRMTEAVDLVALAAAAVPDEVVARLRGAREVLAVGHENPDADTLGATLALCRLVEAIGGRATAVFSDEPPPIYAFMPDVERVRPDPDPAVAYDLLVLSDCATAERVGAVAGPPPGAVPRPAAGDHRPPRLQRRTGAGGLGRSRLPPRRAR